MSGFAGVVSLDGAPADARLLERMAERLAFRGPDGTHITAKPGAGLCFTFLRTGPAPQCPSQPCSLDGRVWLLGDVRLDGRDDLRRKLEQHGEEVDGDVTDEELLLRAWRRWGEDGLADLIGDYSFALWDAEARVLWCARDLMGARPFFYTQAGNRLYFSNTLEAMRCAQDISSALDLHFIGDFLLQDWCSDPQRTAFRNISRLPGGHMLRYSTAGIAVRRFASLPIEEPLWLKREKEYVEQFRKLLEQAVRERLPRGPAAVLMSGGLDSTSVAAIATKIAKKSGSHASLRAHTVDYRPLFDDEEAYYASLAAEHLGIPIEILQGASCIPYEGWSDSELRMPEPCHEPFLAGSGSRGCRIGRIRRGRRPNRTSLALSGLSVPKIEFWQNREDLRRIHPQARTSSATAGRFSCAAATVDGPQRADVGIPEVAGAGLRGTATSARALARPPAGAQELSPFASDWAYGTLERVLAKCIRKR